MFSHKKAFKRLIGNKLVTRTLGKGALEISGFDSFKSVRRFGEVLEAGKERKVVS